MPFGRRAFTLLAVLVLLGAPALVLRVLCVGASCEPLETVASEVPFCSLPPAVRDRLVAGFREGRSPELLVVTGRAKVAGSTAPGAPDSVPWPARTGAEGTRVPIVFAGRGVDPDARIPEGTGLDDVAPTEARILGIHRPHPEVRSGQAIEDVASGDPPRLVLEVVLAGVGSAELEAAPEDWPALARLMDAGAGTLKGDAASLPLDPAAALTTLGTGGLPYQHGITGTFVRNDAGELVRAYGERAPVSVIATLADDLDEMLNERPLIGLVAGDVSERGAVGGNWYVNGDRDALAYDPDDQVGPAVAMLESGFGRDETSDFMAVVLHGRLRQLDDALDALARAAGRASGGSAAIVVAGTGSAAGPGSLSAGAVSRGIEGAVEAPVVEAAVPGGLYLDQKALARERVEDDELLAALGKVDDPSGRRLFDDRFQSIAVSFARYC